MLASPYPILKFMNGEAACTCPQVANHLEFRPHCPFACVAKPLFSFASPFLFFASLFLTGPARMQLAADIDIVRAFDAPGVAAKEDERTDSIRPLVIGVHETGAIYEFSY